MKYLNTDKCGCGHYKADHDVRLDVFEKAIQAICWDCAANSLSTEGLNLDCYHNFKLENLEYLQRLYEDKQKVK